MQLQFDNITLNVRPHPVHVWALTTAEVAEGYGVSPEAIRQHKHRNADELTEGKHFISVTNSNAVRNQADTYWTKRGVVRLGFLIKSERAKRFRDWAEDLVIAVAEQSAFTLPRSFPEALRALAAEIEGKDAAERRLAEVQPKLDHYLLVMDADGSYTIAEVAKMIGAGPNKLFGFLRERQVLYQIRGHNVPMQPYVDNGWFVVRQTCYQHGDRQESYPKLFVTPKGLAGIRKKWMM